MRRSPAANELREYARRRSLVDQLERKVIQRRPSTGECLPHSEQLPGESLPQEDVTAISQRPLKRRATVVQFLLQLDREKGVGQVR